ncbi:MAG: hypothetical protein KUG73_06835 [Pseudomonadales bacterium]|nr:hypothetical protein [Pseudomonadales bacterium]
MFQRIHVRALLGACFLLALSLSACDSKAPLEPVANGVTSDGTSKSVAQASKVAKKKLKKKLKEKPKKKLDLTLSQDVMALSTNSFDESNLDEHHALPNMFEEKQEGTTVGAGILRDAENEDYVDSIQGAEVNVEFKID